MTAKITAEGGVVLALGKKRLAYILPEIFTEGWAKNTPRASRKDKRYQGVVTLPDGSIGLKTVVTPVRDGFQVHSTLTALSAVKVIHIRQVVNLPYGDWKGTPFAMGKTRGIVPVDPEADNKIAEGRTAALDLGPNPKWGGQALRIKAPRLHMVLQDNRQWTPYLHAFVTRGEPSAPAWFWKEGIKKEYRLTLTLSHPNPSK